MLYVLWTSHWARHFNNKSEPCKTHSSATKADEQDFWQKTWHALPLERQEKIRKLRHTEDKNLRAASYFVLRYALMQEFSIDKEYTWFSAAYGKPYLDGADVFFSLSYIPQGVLCAVAREEVGADIEMWESFAARKGAPWEKFFNAEELYRIARAHNRAEAVCTLWAAKESVYKYRGQGLQEGMPLVLQDKNVQVHTLSLVNKECCVALCRSAASQGRLPSIQEVQFEQLQPFWQR